MKSFNHGRTFMGRLQKGEDLLAELNRVVKGNEINNGIVKVIGAVSRAKIGYYDQKDQEYYYNELEQDLEIANCTGNISIMDEEPFIHAHITLADEEGRSYGGHLTEGTIIYAAEVYIQELEGESLIRTFDRETKLSLW